MQLNGANVTNFYGITSPVSAVGSVLEPSWPVKIPIYQRPYTWSGSMVCRLINDWQEVGDNYFAGTLVSVYTEETINNPGSGDPKTEARTEIIDGQQRYTTLFLVNFLYFNINRLCIRQQIDENKLGNAANSIKELKKSFKYLFCSSKKAEPDFLKQLDELELLIQQVLDDHEPIEDHLHPHHKKLLMFPDILESEEEYDKEYHAIQLNFFKSDTLILSYGRLAIGAKLSSCLSSMVLKMSNASTIVQNFYEVETEESKGADSYVVALKNIFDSFYKDKSVGTSLTHAAQISHDYKMFLQTTELCVIQTPHSDDAYTLFEVLNDRSSPLSDLELIKNQFYKKIVDQKSVDKKRLSELLEELDTQWSEKIFKDASDIKTKTITYLAGTFLTKDYKVTHGEPFRKSLQHFLKTVVPFGEKDAQKIFNVYEGVTIFIDVFEISFSNNILKKSINVEFDQDKSHICKVVHLLVALKQYGVLAGIFCVLLNEIKAHYPDLSPSDVKSEFEKACDSGVVKSSKYDKINKAALYMWSLVMASEDYKAPLEYAKELIEDNSYASASTKILTKNISSVDIKALNNWLASWNYGKSKTNNFKVKTLLARLIQFQLDTEDKLKLYDFRHASSKDLELDHMEPQELNSSAKKMYFIPKHDRDYYINGLGNMMLLTGPINKTKGNKPMYTIIAALQAAGLKDDWLYKNIVTLLGKNNKEEAGEFVPTKKFFEKRKEHLINRIIELVNLDVY